MIKASSKLCTWVGLQTQCAVLEEGLVEKVIDVQDFDHPSRIHLQTMQTTMKLTQACTQTII